ncbi:pyridoxine 5'-phosphate synthase [Mesonia maritima]|uniref:Pyridoxine 5'-phosphate synthase n=1 Tax=Mesonia maritima TaxID=1793873 RepID=A0ABU1K4M0_9FLAO|nr:pyridoxine 5'-phosphate synthase [Mesonia maritima]MDR6300205.1 pyridoxine 5-phosphate synthase [Mesonia maritima]
MTKLSVNINKIATLRNARGGNIPNVVEAAKNAEKFGAQGITVHPRPDERHIRYQDVRDLAPVVTTEFNIEGNPFDDFIDLVLKNKPTQVTLVPDDDNVLTSNAGWDTIKHQEYLKEIIAEFKKHNIRTSIFVDPDPEMIKGAQKTGTDRIELYTEEYAVQFAKGNKEKAVKPYAECAKIAQELGLGINAGHDLSLQNIKYFKENVPGLLEVSIGHALIAEALYDGLENVIQQYLKLLK